MTVVDDQSERVVLRGMSTIRTRFRYFIAWKQRKENTIYVLSVAIWFLSHFENNHTPGLEAWFLTSDVALHGAVRTSQLERLFLRGGFASVMKGSTMRPMGMVICMCIPLSLAICGLWARHGIGEVSKSGGRIVCMLTCWVGVFPGSAVKIILTKGFKALDSTRHGSGGDIRIIEGDSRWQSTDGFPKDPKFQSVIYVDQNAWCERCVRTHWKIWAFKVSCHLWSPLA